MCHRARVLPHCPGVAKSCGVKFLALSRPITSCLPILFVRLPLPQHFPQKTNCEGTRPAIMILADPSPSLPLRLCHLVQFCETKTNDRQTSRCGRKTGRRIPRPPLLIGPRNLFIQSAVAQFLEETSFLVTQIHMRCEQIVSWEESCFMISAASRRGFLAE